MSLFSCSTSFDKLSFFLLVSNVFKLKNRKGYLYIITLETGQIFNYENSNYHLLLANEEANTY
jgi:hypothetical protein